MILEVDWMLDIKEARRLVPENIVLMGNVDPSFPLVIGTPIDVDAAVRDLIEATQGRSHIVSSGCAMGSVIHLPRILRHLLRRPVNMARMRRYYVYKINNGGMADLNKLFDSIVAGKLESAVEVTEQILKEDLDIQLIINNYMIKAMEEIGDRFQRQQAYVPELLMAARAMKGSLELLKSHLKGERLIR